MDNLLTRLNDDDLIEPSAAFMGFSRNSRGLDMRVLLSDDDRTEFEEYWTIRCESFLEYDFSSKTTSGAVSLFGETHVAVRQFIDPSVQIFFVGRPKSIADLLFELGTAHERVAGHWISMSRYLRATPERLAAGSGAIYDGPKFLWDAYQPILEASGLKLNQPSKTLERTVVTPELQMLIVDGSYVVGSGFTATREGTRA